MSKAVTGAVEIAAGVALLLSPIGGAVGAMFLPLILSGASSEVGALASLLQGQQGMASTTRTAASPRRIIYGTQRVGGVEVYQSTTGSSTDQYNFVVVFAAHEVTNIIALYLDGRQVYWAETAGYTVRNGIGFGGGADGVPRLGPDGSIYWFFNGISGHRGVYAEARFGDQPAGDYIGGLTSNDGRWAPSGSNAPSLLGHAYIYLKVEYNTDDFPNTPEIKVLIAGKAVYDPRTGETAYSDNWALVVADILQNTDYGLGETVNVDQLIAAANICDEQVAFAGGSGGMENRYTCNYTWTLDKGIGSVLDELMAGAGARISKIEGEWFLFPATYVAPAASFNSSQLIAASPWSSQRKFKDKCNLVQGTYTAPVYPYSVAGDYYGVTKNSDGSLAVQNNFNFAYQPASYPTFTLDTAHGYPANQYLEEDGNVELPLSLDFPSVLSVSQAQRLGKIALLRNRQQGSGTIIMGVEALLLQPNDTFMMTWPQRGWANKVLEIQQMDFSIQAGEDGAPQIQVALTVNETDPTVYEWNPTDELSPSYAPVFTVGPNTYTTQPPTDMELISSAATALTQADGTVAPRIEVTWNTPADSRVTQIQIQYKLSSVMTWTDAGSVSVQSNSAFIAPVVAGKQYDVRIRSLRPNGGTSVWVELDEFTAGFVLSVLNTMGVGIGSLSAAAFDDGTATIYCNPFSALVGQNLLPIFPSGEVSIPGLLQQTRYFVYYDDPTYTGGNVTPVATLNRPDVYGVLGRFLIDSIVTPYLAPSSGGLGVRYSPANAVDLGTRSTLSPASAYDGDLATAAGVAGSVDASGNSATGNCQWTGFQQYTTTAAVNLNFTLAAVYSTAAIGSAVGIYAFIGGVETVLTPLTASTATTTYSIPIPIGTDLSTVVAGVSATPLSVHNTNFTAFVYEVYIE